tara:strand:+ start:45231 stop:45866 length:636 start_codon:yes stop_codon:yes gene_type:complete
MADTRTLSQFKNRLAGGGARSNLFEVTLPSFPSAVGDRVWRTGSGREASTFSFLAKAAQLPASTMAEVPVPFRGRTLKVAGDRTFEPWTVTVINDEDFQLRTAFEIWMNTMNRLSDSTGVTNPSSYMTDAYVTQLGRGRTANSAKNVGGTSSELRTYKFYDIFPTEVSAIELSYDNSDQIEDFTVTFQVQYFTVGNSTQANRGAAGQTLIQ